jgi:hypothetical protein
VTFSIAHSGSQTPFAFWVALFAGIGFVLCGGFGPFEWRTPNSFFPQKCCLTRNPALISFFSYSLSRYSAIAAKLFQTPTATQRVSKLGTYLDIRNDSDPEHQGVSGFLLNEVDEI